MDEAVKECTFTPRLSQRSPRPQAVTPARASAFYERATEQRQRTEQELQQVRAEKARRSAEEHTARQQRARSARLRGSSANAVYERSIEWLGRVRQETAERRDQQFMESMSVEKKPARKVLKRRTADVDAVHERLHTLQSSLRPRLDVKAELAELRRLKLDIYHSAAPLLTH